MALINTAALCMLLTLRAPATATAKPHGSITVIQPGGDCMTTTHAVNLLLCNLPPEARLRHCLPGLVNNLLSIAALVNAGCKVFFHRTGCKVAFDGTVILQGWHDPKNKLWHVKIMDYGWTTNLHAPPIMWPNSLDECLTTHKLMHFYYTCLNFLVMLALILALNAGYLKGFPDLTADRVR